MSNELTFGSWLRQQRNELGVTQEELAEHLGFSAAMLRKLESGERRPSGQIADLLADFFRIPTDERAAFIAFARTGQTALIGAAPAAGGVTPLPPWRGVYLRQTNLPAMLAPLIGREREGAAARDQLLHPKTRLLTLTGGPGIGKTRLGLQVAADLVEHFADGVFFVDLAPIVDPAMVVPTVARTLGLKEADTRPIEIVLTDYIGERRMLLLLDNFEQVLDAAPAIVKLMEASPWLKVLVTSREALHVRGERRFPVPPLDLPDLRQLPALAVLADYAAVALFVERAQAVAPEFDLTDENATDVAAVCIGLEGLPLAIELAAARARSFSSTAMRSALSSRLTLLTDGARDLPTRHKTIRAAIAWSYDLLNEDEQRLFRRLGVFVGGFTSAAVDGIGVPPPDPQLTNLDTLRSLIDKHLVREERPGVPPVGGRAAGRFGLLEAVREYALEQLETHGETTETRGKHADYYLALAEEAEQQFTGPHYRGWGAEGLEWIDRLETELDNSRSALDWYERQEKAAAGTRFLDSLLKGLRLTLGLRRVWFVRGYFTEGLQRLMALLARVPKPVPPEPRDLRATYAMSLAISGRLSTIQGDTRSGPARPLLEESLRIAHELNSAPLLTFALLNVGVVVGIQGDYAAARAYHRECLQLHQDLGNKWGMAAALEELGNTALQEGSIVAARPLLEESLTLFREVDDPFGAGSVLERLGHIAYSQDDYAAARAWWEESRRLRQEVRDRSRVCHSLVLLGWAALRQRNPAEARVLFSEGLLLARELGAVLTIYWCLVGWGALARVEQSPATAALLFGAAEALRESRSLQLSPANQAERDAEIAAAHAQLQGAPWDQAWAAGRAMTLEQAITYAAASRT